MFGCVLPVSHLDISPCATPAFAATVCEVGGFAPTAGARAVGSKIIPEL